LGPILGDEGFRIINGANRRHGWRNVCFAPPPAMLIIGKGIAMDIAQALQQLTTLIANAPDWCIVLIDLVLCVGGALVVHALVYRLLVRLANHTREFVGRLLVRLKGPTRLTAALIGLTAAIGIAPQAYGRYPIIQHVLLMGVILLIAWIAWTALNLWLTFYLQRFEDQGDFHARKHVTQTHILKRVLGFLIWFSAVAACLMTFDEVRQYGISLLASAGAAGLIVGLALQPVLKNLIAGIQIAITQPIKIGDSLNVEGEFGTVEDIKATYVVVRTWDLRRLVLPLSYFIEQPFQNWTRESTNLLGAAMIYLDYSAPIEALRAKAREIVEMSPLWDHNVFALQITDFRERTMEVRVLVSASTSGKLFDLRCVLREQLIAYLQAQHPRALPRTRTEETVVGSGHLELGHEAGHDHDSDLG
jgi:small-conductance mechanosensitive channel